MKAKYPTLKDRNAKYLLANVFAKLEAFYLSQVERELDSNTEETVEVAYKEFKGKNIKRKNRDEGSQKVVQEEQEDEEDEDAEQEQEKELQEGQEYQENEEEEQEEEETPKKVRRKRVKSPHNTPPLPN